MKENTFIAILGFIVLLGFSACNLETDKGFYFDEKTFTSEWNAWENRNIKNYSFTLTGELPNWNFSRAILMHEYKVNIIVKNGTMDSFEYIGDVPYSEDEETILEPEFTSISDMYQKIFDRAKEEREWWENHSGEGGFVSTTLKVKYDSELHYITFFEPITEVESGWILDTTNHAVTISNFTDFDGN
jgi:hypothetical protein